MIDDFVALAEFEFCWCTMKSTSTSSVAPVTLHATLNAYTFANYALTNGTDVFTFAAGAVNIATNFASVYYITVVLVEAPEES